VTGTGASITRRSASLLLLLLSVPAILCAETKKVTFLPQWQPQAQFAGYYVAQEKGFYTRRGIDLTILRGGPDQPPSELLSQHRTDFGTMFLSTAIEKRSWGVPVVNIGQIVSRSALLLIAKKSSGIASPKDFDGKKVSVWPEFQTQPDALFRKFQVRPRVVVQGSTVNLFLRDAVDVASAMWYNEYHLILNSGMDENELTVFFFDRYGVSFPEDGIYCLDETLQRDPALCRAVVQASIEGWIYVFEHPAEALDIVMRHVNAANIATNRMHQEWMLARMKDIILPSDRREAIGVLTREEYQRVANELLTSQSIAAVPDFETIYEDCATR